MYNEKYKRGNKMQRKPYVKTNSQNLSINEAREIAEVSRQTIFKWLSNDRFEYEKKANGYVLIDKESFVDYITELKNRRIGKK